MNLPAPIHSLTPLTDAVQAEINDCPECGPDRLIRLWKDRRQCGGCGFLIEKGSWLVD